jgi:hypothetical protein
MRLSLPGSVVLTAINLVLGAAALLAAHSWFTARATSYQPTPTARESPEAASGLTNSSFTYYLVGTDEQAALLDKMVSGGSVFIIRSRGDEAIADSVISDDSQQISATGGRLFVQDLRLTATPERRTGTIIQSQVQAKLPGAPFEPGYADGVTYFIVDSSAQAALLDATLQRLGGTSGPASRYVIAAIDTPEETNRLVIALQDSAAFPGGVPPYRIINLQTESDLAPIETDGGP